MVANLYSQFGFEKVAEDDTGATIWHYRVPVEPALRNRSIKVNEK